MFQLILLIFLCFFKNSTADNSTLEQQPSQHKACPRSTLPYFVAGKIKVCKPKDSNACPSGFKCYFDGDEEYVCCGRNGENSPTGGNSTKEIQFQPPPIACPRNTSPHIVDGRIKECKPGDATACPEGFICYFDGIGDSRTSGGRGRYICCGKTPGYCEAGQPYVNPGSNKVQECAVSEVNGRCKSPYRCESRASGPTGFCCLNIEAIEPPPVGCPWGTRPLKSANQVVINCLPGTNNACPGDAICYFDSVERTNRCCGRDPGEGCPTGTRAYKRNNQIINCLPGELTQECPDATVCHWSYLTDRFQCCQADSGCPLGMIPLIGLNNVVQTCVRDQPNSCPQQYNCEFNFWIASYQCCGRSSGFCPVGQVPYLESGTNQARTCILNQPGICPAGYNCQSSSSGQFVCCGPAGQCPSGTLVTDSQGRAQVCSPGITSGCPSTATCSPAIGGAAGQFLCCSTGTTNQCPTGFTLPNGQVIQCNPSMPTTCIGGSNCLQSQTQPGFFLCCSTSTGSQCPVGFEPLNNQIIPCSPSAPGTCFSNSQCMASISQPGTFLCCSVSSTSQCPVGTPQNNQITQCIPSAPTACLAGSACLQSTRVANFFLCCTTGTSALQCPSGFMLQNNIATMCTTSTMCTPGNLCLQALNQPGTQICCTQSTGTQCPAGFMLQNNIVTVCTSAATCLPGNQCLQSTNLPSMLICCTSTIGTTQCPTGTRLQNGITTPCTLTTTSTCLFGAFCLSALTSPSTQVCCSVDSINTIQCPFGYQLQNNVVQQCNPSFPNACNPGSSCLSVTMLPGASVCCTQGSTTAQCPPTYTLQNGQVTPCNPSLSTCFSGSFCLASPTNPNSFYCCTPGGTSNPTCPSGFTLQGGTVTFCNPLQPTCVLAGAQCLASPGMSNINICCVPGSTSTYTCPNNLQPYMVGANYYFCTLTAPNCPAGSTCQQSVNVPGLYLCCQSGTSSQYQCPASAQPLMTGSSYTFCNPTSGPFCPSTYACQQAINAPTIYICCTSSSLAPTCPSGLTPYSSTPGQYVYCSATNPTCPGGASCQTATNMANTYVCCTSSTATFTCPGNMQIVINLSGQPTICTSSPGACPSPSTCNQAVNNPSISVCCQPGSGTNFCPANQQPLYVGGQLQFCTGVGATCQSISYSCQFSSTLNQFLCCGSGTSSDVCPVGQQPLYFGTQLQFCTGAGAACPSSGYACQFSNSMNRFVCCGGTTGAVRCANNQPMYQPSTTTFFCTISSNQCPAQYDCLPSTLPNQNVCCLRSSTGSWQCVSGRVPYPNSVNPLTCSPGASNCPAETACEQSTLPNQFICCNLGTRQPQCPNSWQPLLDGLTPRRCTGPSDTSCQSPYSCVASDNMGVYICCQFSSGLRCFTGAQPYLLPNGQPQQCSTAAPNCPPNYSCQSSTQPGTLICCGASFQGNIFCPDGSQPYRVGTQPFYCGPTVTCPATHQCVQSSVPAYQVCCLPTTTSSVCLSGQQPLLVNNQPQICRITSPQCQQGYMCQQSSSGVYYCCQTPQCPSGVTLVTTTGQPRYCNPASSSCPTDATCQQAINLPGNFICCILQTGLTNAIARCIGRTTYLPTGSPVPCAATAGSCPSGNECSSFTTTRAAICCVSTIDQVDPMCPSGEPFRDPTSKQYHYCSSTNYACPLGFVCKQMVNSVVGSDQYLCCSSKKTCQFGWAPFMDRTTNLPVECNPSGTNACIPPGPPYKCQQSTIPGEYLCCMETMIAFGEENATTTLTTAKSVNKSSTPSVVQKIRWIFG